MSLSIMKINNANLTIKIYSLLTTTDAVRADLIPHTKQNVILILLIEFINELKMSALCPLRTGF